MENKKLEAIKKAYGEHWDTVKQHVNENGYLYHPKGGKVTFEPFIGFMDQHFIDDAYRPKSLKGIETNNGWTVINSVDDLPKESTYCWFIISGASDVSYGRYITGITPLNRFFLYNGGHYDFSRITHYKPINKPLPPIY